MVELHPRGMRTGTEAVMIYQPDWHTSRSRQKSQSPEVDSRVTLVSLLPARSRGGGHDGGQEASAENSAASCGGGQTAFFPSAMHGGIATGAFCPLPSMAQTPLSDDSPVTGALPNNLGEPVSCIIARCVR